MSGRSRAECSKTINIIVEASVDWSIHMCASARVCVRACACVRVPVRAHVTSLQAVPDSAV